jgi:hypothetical protein
MKKSVREACRMLVFRSGAIYTSEPRFPRDSLTSPGFKDRNFSTNTTLRISRTE